MNIPSDDIRPLIAVLDDALLLCEDMMLAKWDEDSDISGETFSPLFDKLHDTLITVKKKYPTL